MTRPTQELHLQRLLTRPLRAEELEANAREVAAPIGHERRLTLSVLLVQLCGERLALPSTFVRRVVATAPVHSIPHRSGPILAGICNVGGELLLVARLDAALGLVRAEAAGERLGARMLVVGEEGASWVIDVDAVEGVRRLDPASQLPPPPTVARALDGCTSALLPVGDGPPAALLDPERVHAVLNRSL